MEDVTSGVEEAMDAISDPSDSSGHHHPSGGDESGYFTSDEIADKDRVATDVLTEADSDSDDGPFDPSTQGDVAGNTWDQLRPFYSVNDPMFERVFEYINERDLLILPPGGQPDCPLEERLQAVYDLGLRSRIVFINPRGKQEECMLRIGLNKFQQIIIDLESDDEVTAINVPCRFDVNVTAQVPGLPLVFSWELFSVQWTIPGIYHTSYFYFDHTQRSLSVLSSLRFALYDSGVETLERLRTCSNCFVKAPRGTFFMRCARCKRAWYCSKKCQILSWAAHHQKLCSMQQSEKSENFQFNFSPDPEQVETTDDVGAMNVDKGELNKEDEDEEEISEPIPREGGANNNNLVPLAVQAFRIAAAGGLPNSLLEPLPVEPVPVTGSVQDDDAEIAEHLEKMGLMDTLLSGGKEKSKTTCDLDQVD